MRKGTLFTLMALLLALGATAAGLATAGTHQAASKQKAAKPTVRTAADPCAGFPMTLQSAGDGKTTWGTVNENGPFPNAVFAVSPFPGWATTLLGTSSWISPKADRTGPATTYYGTSFSLSQYTLDFATLALSGSFLADNRAQAFFNSAPGPAQTGSSFHNFFDSPEAFTAPFSTLNPFNSSPNGNVLSFKVDDDGGVTGLDYSATLTCVPKYPDLSIVKTASSTQWTVGIDNTFTTTVTAGGPGTVPAGAVITVNDSVPAGLIYVSAGGSGWTSCTAGPIPGPTSPSCTYVAPSGGLPVNQPLPAITWTVKPTAPGAFTNCAATAGQTAQTGGVALPESDQANDQNNKSCASVKVVAPPPSKLDHFKCYVPKGSISAKVLGPVTLQDEFDGGKFEQVKVTKLFRFCNPVQKSFRGKVTPIRNPKLHLTFYSIVTKKTGNHSLLISNQFGKQQIVAGPPRWLAVPTSKNEKTQPNTKLLSHFKCYPVLKGKSVNAVVTLKDQWHTEPQVKAGVPVIFCNPALKRHGNRIFPIVDKLSHLLCYQLTANPFLKSAYIVNQFNQTTLTVLGADILCVPSQVIPPNPCKAIGQGGRSRAETGQSAATTR